MSQSVVDDVPPPLPRRAPQRDSTGSPQISPVRPSHPSPAETTPPAQSAQTDKALPAQPSQPEQAAHPQPTSAQAVPNGFPMAAFALPTETIKTKREELAAGDAHWQWKVGLRAISIIVGLIGIGAAGWVTSHFTTSFLDQSNYYYNLDDGYSLPWTLITFSLSVFWSAVCIIVFFARRPNAPVHPGAQVGVDLILWIVFIFTGLFAVIGTMSVANWGSDGRLGYSGTADGYYTQVTNGTWIWHSTQYSSYYGEDRPCNGTRSSSRSNMFSSCEQQDAYVNALYKDVKGTRYSLDLMATVCQFISLTVHLILFIWACVDTHYRRRRHVTKDAEKLAAEIVMNMVRSGAIIPPPGQAHYRPVGQQMPQMMPIYPQQYPQHQQQLQPQPGQYPQSFPPPMQPHSTPAHQPAHQPAVASSSDEKGAGLRYA